MVLLEVETIQSIIQEIGLAPTKARNLRKMAEQILESGGIRGEWEYLENLAGVGHKTASVVMSQYYGFPAFPLIPISIDLLKDGDSQKVKTLK